MYTLGIDMGTTFTAAATWRDGHAEIVPLGSRSAAIPSVVLLREDETFLTGEAANRRGLTEPHRVAREFKRRVGDTTPILVGGVPQSAEALMSRLLRAVADQVIDREGGPPPVTCVSHPANWGAYKIDLLRQAVRMADLEGSVIYTTEPEAAAVSYAQQQRIEPGAVVAVYDLGGGTFDAAVLRKTATGFDILGRPEGIERLGGIDFDAAVFHHVRSALAGQLKELDEDDPGAIAAVARLREECVQAKEALSADTDTTIPVLLPNLVTEVRLTRSELEAMVRPALYGSVEALKRAIRSAGTAPDELHSVLLVGGSSRMPIVAQMVTSEFGRPVAVDAHPKHAVALGGAWLASGASSTGTVSGRAVAPAPPAASRPEPASPKARPAPPIKAGVAAVPTSPAAPRPVSPAPARPTSPAPAGPSSSWATSVLSAGAASPPQAGRASPPAPPTRGRRGKRRLLIGAGLGLALLLAAGGVAYAQYGRDDGKKNIPAAAIQPSVKPSPTLPADEQCTDEIKSNRRWVCLTSAVLADGKLTINYNVDYDGSTPDVDAGYHLHIYGGDGKYPPDHLMGSHAPKS
ncbi:Hsp70 family protein [Actinoplanes sp. TBRC 11911]|uniref:Hsp70 family protein n=1 Tax=Actinoplanes sp. TBRC 11911 TaxID=2729386 RepID=UPI00145E2F6E|nr:Hsp70 family protein [Actinoplanes sp. TBRC 11911]NMO49701.1 Hsp70 family protein [Actinoplanes sp. TBRC 11911]